MVEMCEYLEWEKDFSEDRLSMYQLQTPSRHRFQQLVSCVPISLGAQRKVYYKNEYIKQLAVKVKT